MTIRIIFITLLLCLTSNAPASLVLTDETNHLVVDQELADKHGPQVEIYAGDGDDEIDLRGAGHYTNYDFPPIVYGEGGNDTLWGAYTTAFLYGGPGDDRFVGGEHSTHIIGGSGNDSIAGSGGGGYWVIYEDRKSMRGYVDRWGSPLAGPVIISFDFLTTDQILKDFYYLQSKNGTFAGLRSVGIFASIGYIDFTKPNTYEDVLWVEGTDGHIPGFDLAIKWAIPSPTTALLFAVGLLALKRARYRETG